MSYYDAFIMDLDGTLWQTQDSYLYAYHKWIENHPHVKNILTDQEVLSTMGNEINIVGDLVFKEYSQTEKLEYMYECLQYSCEYLLSHKSTLYRNVEMTIKNVHEQIKLFIVSNCPEVYIKIFFQKSELKECFVDYRFLTKEKDKSQNIRDLINEYQLQKVLMIGDSDEDCRSLDHQIVDFCYASYGYKKCYNYDFILNDFDDLTEIIKFTNRRQAILKNCPEYYHLSYQDAHITIMKNDLQKTEKYLFGFWRYSSNHDNNHQLFIKVDEKVNLLGIKRIIGPIDYTTWFTYRLAISGFDLRFFPDIHNKYEQVLFLKQRGYLQDVEYVSVLANIDYKLWSLGKTVKLSSDYQIKIFHDEEAYQHFTEIYQISIDCFSDNYLYSPIDFNDFKNLYLENLSYIRPDLLVVYYQEKPIAFSFSYEDPYRRHYVSKTVGIKKQFQNSRLILKIIDEAFRLMEKRGYQVALYHFQNHDTKVLHGIWRHEVIQQKFYALFSKGF